MPENDLESNSPIVTERVPCRICGAPARVVEGNPDLIVCPNGHQVELYIESVPPLPSEYFGASWKVVSGPMSSLTFEQLSTLRELFREFQWAIKDRSLPEINLMELRRVLCDSESHLLFEDLGDAQLAQVESALRSVHIDFACERM